MKEKMEALRQSFEQELQKAASSDAVEKLRVAYLGKKGSVTELLKGLKTVSAQEKKELGQHVNHLKKQVEEKLAQRVEAIQAAYGAFDGIVINPAAYTHTSVALLDAVKAVGIPTVEVHISDPDSREEFRHVSYIRQACIATIKGHGLEGYLEALRLLAK